jgi:hypothetical protein
MIPAIKDPTKEDVDKYHQIFLDAMIGLIDRHKEGEGYGHRKVTII